MRFQEIRSSYFSLRLRFMPRTVDFDDQLPAEADEIDNVVAGGVLTSKVCSGSIMTEMLPEDAFGRSRVHAELLSALMRDRCGAG